jgi:Icc protein
VLVQLSDPHIGADWDGVDPGASLAAAVEKVRSLRPAPEAILVSGDLAETAADAEYERLRALLAPLPGPLHVLPGNHDRVEPLRRHFDTALVDGRFIQYTADVAGMRLVALDTTRPGEERGELDATRLEWLDGVLAAAPERPTVIAMHHPPIGIGIWPIDRIGLPPADRNALAEVIGRHPQVRRLICGHAHRAATGEFAGRVAMVAPSTFMELRPDFLTDQLEVASGPVGFAVHVLVDGDVVSHVQTVETPR